ncbi:MAG: C10 family peptidase [candidate division Zixibacteria bacterium]|nr:C10 family peptidase [candidate division Zixibacteria bacterium]
MNPRQRARQFSLKVKNVSFQVALAILFVVLLPWAQVAYAELATADQMEQICRNWLTVIVTEKGDWGGSTEPTIVDIQDIVENDTLVARYYAIDPAGYIMVPALKEMAPVSAYSDEYALDIHETGGGMAVMMRQIFTDRFRIFVQTYGSLETVQAIDRPLFDPNNQTLWNKMTVPPDQFVPRADKVLGAQMLSVGPFLTTAWHQGAPYNDLCPEGDGGRCAVGCVATAAAQIARYHQWPPYGTGTHSYYWGGDTSCDGSTPGQTLSADFTDAYAYDDSPAAVAELSYEMGIAFSMDYGVCGSGAYTLDGANVFPEHFNYDAAATTRNRSNYSAEDWFGIIQDEIDQGRPILYRIYSHAIVCDGWRQVSGLNQYHFNYGWGGSQTTWYTVDNLYCPWSGCDPMVEGMVINIIPKTSIIWLGGTALTDLTGGDGDNIPEAGETVDLVVTVANFGAAAVSDVTAQLLVDDASISVLDGSTTYSYIGARDSVKNTADPFRLSIPADYISRIDSFFVILTCNAGATVDTLVFEKSLGRTGVLLVDDDGYTSFDSYYRSAFENLRIPYDIWIHESYAVVDSALLAAHDIVVWFTGGYRADPLSSAEITRLTGYMNAGGRLFLSGQGIAAELSTDDTTFLHDYLKSEYLSTSLVPLLWGAAEAQIMTAADSVLIMGSGGAGNQTNPDHISAVNGGVAELGYYSQTDYGAVSYLGSYRLAFFAFGFEAISNGDSRWAYREEVLTRVLDFFEYGLPTNSPMALNVVPTPGVRLNMTDHAPAITWTYYDPQELPQQMYQVQMGTDTNWTVAEMWAVGPTAGSETAIPYAGAELIDGHRYYYRVRVYNGVVWSTWAKGDMRMNSRPSTPTNQTPSGFVGTMSETPDLTVTNATDNEYDTRTYAFEIYDDSLMTTLAASAEHQTQGAGTTTKWKVVTVLSDDEDYYWRTLADDGYELSDWTPLASFWVNSTNLPPTSFGLVSPADESKLSDRQPTFVWNSSIDNDRFDRVVYTLYYATDSIFYGTQSVSGIQDTQVTITQLLQYGKRYYWRVMATDLFSTSTYSSDVYTFLTTMIGDANGDGTLNVGDAIYIISYIFREGPAPDPIVSADANCDGKINVSDAVYLINYIFRGGPPPQCNK